MADLRAGCAVTNEGYNGRLHVPQSSPTNPPSASRNCQHLVTPAAHVLSVRVPPGKSGESTLQMSASHEATSSAAARTEQSCMMMESWDGRWGVGVRDSTDVRPFLRS